MKRTMIGMVLVIAGCANSAHEADATQIEQALRGYVSAATRAERTVTHASGEYPMAVAEMERHEAALRTACRTEDGRRAVARAIEEKLSTEAGSRVLVELKGKLGL
ncbi:MAG: hypothetical protein HYY16_02310 [Planctomycetes bacterium]|nr:hypothetical protein [Planctomycetota bacterium]